MVTMTTALSEPSVTEQPLCFAPGLGGVVKTAPPFSRPLLLNFLGEVFAARSSAPDESIHSFMGRRLGTEVSWYRQATRSMARKKCLGKGICSC